MPVTVGLGAASPQRASFQLSGRSVMRSTSFFSQPGTAGSFGDAVKVIEAEQPEEALVAAHRRQD